MSLRVALGGCGRWGSTLLRALVRHPQFRVDAVADTSPLALAKAAVMAPSAALEDDFVAMLQRRAPDLDAVLIATPNELHMCHAHAALSAGLDVFVEKPLALSARDADELCQHLREANRVGMVGHLLRYHPTLQGIVALARAGGLGRIRSVTGRRLTQSGTPSPLWALGPHDLSTLFAIDPSAEAALTARTVRDGVCLHLELDSGTRAHFELSTTSSDPQRQLRVAGSLRSVELDELKGRARPLDFQLDHLAGCIRSSTTPLTSFEEASKVVATLARAQQQLDRAGTNRSGDQWTGTEHAG